MALRLGPAALLHMLMPNDARFALGLVLSCLAGVLSLFAAHHPVLALGLPIWFGDAVTRPILVSCVSTVMIPGWFPFDFAGLGPCLPLPWHHFRLRFIALGRSCCPRAAAFAACVVVVAACFVGDGLHEACNKINDSRVASLQTNCIFTVVCGVWRAPSISNQPRLCFVTFSNL